MSTPKKVGSYAAKTKHLNGFPDGGNIAVSHLSGYWLPPRKNYSTLQDDLARGLLAKQGKGNKKRKSGSAPLSPPTLL